MQSRQPIAGAPTGPIRVMLVDDHSLVRLAIRQALGKPGIEVVGEAATAEDALSLAPQLRPDVMLVDIGLPGMNGVDLVRELAPRIPATRIVMLTVSTDDADVADAVGNGAAGFLTKDVAPEALVRAVRGAHRGDLVVPRQMAARLVRNLAERSRRAPTPIGAAGNEISPRETEVLRLVAEGYTDREIAKRLTLSQRTVETHVSNVLRKLNVDNRREAGRLYRSFT
ncbi:MAG: response regulator transcription factor [Chloroflexota bacterium]|nr:MAG: response regulator transcription factor [Chloroflexota bacterium]